MQKTFAHHKPGPEGLERITKLREGFSALLELLESAAPQSRERAVAVTHLETSAMWAIKAVIHNDPAAEVIS